MKGAPGPSEAVMRMVLESAVDYAIITTDLVGTVTSWNEGAERVLGWSVTEMLGQSIDTIFTADDKAVGMSAQERGLALERGRANDERWHQRQEGGQFWASGRMMPLRDADGAAAGFLKILRDETQRHEAERALVHSEAALVRSEAQFRATFEQSAVSIAHVGLDGSWLRVNSRLCAMLNRTEAEVMATTLKDVTHPDDWEGSLAQMRQLLAGEVATYTLEERYLRRDGSALWAEVTVSLVRDGAGTPDYLIAVGRPVDDRKAAEAALRDSEGRFYALANNIPTLAWMAQADGTITWYNRRWHEYCGTSPDMGGWEWQSVHDPAVLPAVLKEWKNCLAAGEPFEMTFPLRGADGTFRPFLTRAVPMRNTQGHVTRWFGTNTDIAERLASEAVNARLAAIVTASNDAIVSFAPEDGRITSWNSGAERMFGYTEREALGAPVGLLLPEDQPQGKPSEVFERAMAGEAVVAHETERLAKDGERVPVSISAARMLAPDGRITGVSGILHDLRPRKQAEAALQDSTDQLRQSQKMEAIGRLAAGVAHDFNNLLQAITGGLELVMDEIAPDSPAHEFIAISLGSAKRGAGLTHLLLAYARKQVLRPQAVDLSSFLPEMRQLLARTLGPRIAVQARAAAGTPPILVDPGQLETALLNLAMNAAHAMPNGGVLLLDAHLDDKDGNVVIAVTDTGVGMDEATVAKVFEPFFTTKGTEGTGLGLSMVQGFAEQSGGHAQVASIPGKGTTIMLWLPVITQVGEDVGGVQAVHRTGAMPRGSGRVLLVDDEPNVLLTAGAFLERAGFAVTRASSGEEALALLTMKRFEVLVTDHAMPGISGTDLIKHACSLDPGLPALLVSGFTETNGPQATPGAALLRKPFERRALLDAVLEALGREQAEDPTSPRRSEDRSQDENLGLR